MLNYYKIMLANILWSSNSFKENKNDIKIYESLKKKFNKSLENKTTENKSKDTSTKNDYDNQNKIMLEKINNYISLLKNDSLNFKNMNVLEILKEEETICTYLCKYVLQNNYLNYDFFTSTLIILKQMSDHLRKDLKQKKFSHDLKKIKINNQIPRSSYKFCHFKDSCVYNYDKNKGGCYADHYVHNLVEADIESLLEYINHNYSENIINHNKEIIKCINTLCFVIKHMSSELNSLCIYCEPSEYDKLHVNKIIKKKNKRRKKKSSNK